MKFLLDAQLPKKLSHYLSAHGHDALHTLDFVESLLISDKPYKLLYVSTGNITNKKLMKLFDMHLKYIIDALYENRLVEITDEHIIIHE